MPVVVVDQPKFFIAVFAAPLDGLGDVPFGGGFSVRRVGVDRPQVTGFPEDFRDVPGQIPPVGVPGAVFADGQRARSLRLRRVPEQEPSEDSADGIYGGYLQVATVHVAQVAAHRPVDAHFAVQLRQFANSTHILNYSSLLQTKVCCLSVPSIKLKAASIILSDRGITYHIQYFLPIDESIEISLYNHFFNYTAKRYFVYVLTHKKP